jgi:hypothetical protein
LRTSRCAAWSYKASENRTKTWLAKLQLACSDAPLAVLRHRFPRRPRHRRAHPRLVRAQQFPPPAQHPFFLTRFSCTVFVNAELGLSSPAFAWRLRPASRLCGCTRAATCITPC